LAAIATEKKIFGRYWYPTYLAHTGTIVNDKSSNVFVSHDINRFLKRFKTAERGKS